MSGTSSRGASGLLLLLAAVLAVCAPAEPMAEQVAEPATQSVSGPSRELLGPALDRIDAAAAAVDSIFQPLPLLTPTQEESLRRYGNSEQLARARALGVGRDRPDEELATLRAEGRLVDLEDSEYWVLRDLDYSSPLVIPAVPELLTEVGRRFQARLAELGAPAFRMEVTSVLRTAADQAALRRVNPNATLGESTHEYGTTVDVLYSAYSAPLEPFVSLDAGVEADYAPVLTRYTHLAVERVAARRALEIKAILGTVLAEMQGEGRVMVTLERQQPVFHMTLAE